MIYLPYFVVVGGLWEDSLLQNTPCGIICKIV